jgi:hypothetical protein
MSIIILLICIIGAAILSWSTSNFLWRFIIMLSAAFIAPNLVYMFQVLASDSGELSGWQWAYISTNFYLACAASFWAILIMQIIKYVGSASNDT